MEYKDIPHGKKKKEKVAYKPRYTSIMVVSIPTSDMMRFVVMDLGLVVESKQSLKD